MLSFRLAYAQYDPTLLRNALINLAVNVWAGASLLFSPLRVRCHYHAESFATRGACAFSLSALSKSPGRSWHKEATSALRRGLGTGHIRLSRCLSPHSCLQSQPLTLSFHIFVLTVAGHCSGRLQACDVMPSGGGLAFATLSGQDSTLLPSGEHFVVRTCATSALPKMHAHLASLSPVSIASGQIDRK